MGLYRKDVTSGDFEILHRLKGTFINLRKKGLVTSYTEYEFNPFFKPLFPIWRARNGEWGISFFKEEKKPLIALPVRDFKKICAVAKIDYINALRVLFNLSILAAYETNLTKKNVNHKFQVKLYTGKVVEVIIVEQRRFSENLWKYRS